MRKYNLFGKSVRILTLCSLPLWAACSLSSCSEDEEPAPYVLQQSDITVDEPEGGFTAQVDQLLHIEGLSKSLDGQVLFHELNLNLKKGDKVFIEGQIRTRNYTDKSGKQRETLEIWAERLELMSRPATAQTNAATVHPNAATAPTGSQPANTPPSDGPLPF